MAITGRARFGQLLLFIALLFGIAMMHTVGHPVPGNDGGAAEHTVASSTAHIASVVHQQIAGPAVLPRTGPELPGMGMDPMAVCLAVLDTFSVFLLAGGLLRPGPATPPAVCHARIFRALWPNPPSRKTLLARLSVLRI
ncbi:hypothetical protein J7E87_30555 [Streptomyces sp. ISL-1]|uniref:hypothetical protein n=1 Tax=Streptomyces sp. ISL-1 TaxID=2817657 RepID=UPI001BEA3CE3|nr:hypothetical protein [Streptomyces sp. ISL-1]MBT2393632.1 hypothetical protein [Streptomyces sp. ISL-1]